MTTSTVTYQGELRTQAIHVKSNTKIITDAPTDNHGKGEAFSPTDLLATSLTSCMLTIMGIKADAKGLDITGSHAAVTKVMQANPRRVAEVNIRLMVKGVPESEQKLMMEVAKSCPVALSLHPDLVQSVVFEFD